MDHPVVERVEVRRLAIPMRRSVEHAASARSTADPIVVSVELFGGVTGYGETLARPYVTGETVESALLAIEQVFLPPLVEMRPARFPNALEMIDALPWKDAQGKPAPAARAAVELALLDAYSKHFERPIADAPGWMGCNQFGPPGSLQTVRHGGVLASNDASRMMRTLRLLWWYGVRDFKLKVGDDGDTGRLDRAAGYLRKPIDKGLATLRVDANGAWSLADAVRRLTRWRDRPIAMVEQPLARGAENDAAELKSCVHQPIMYDESLVTMKDAESLVERQAVDGFNIRISKCGGLLPALRLAQFAQRNGIAIQLGCMVGETSILSAAGRRFLEFVPAVRFVEGSFGRMLLKDDIVPKSLRFGYGGRVAPLRGPGWGVDVDVNRLDALSTHIRPFVF